MLRLTHIAHAVEYGGTGLALPPNARLVYLQRFRVSRQRLLGPLLREVHLRLRAKHLRALHALPQPALRACLYRLLHERHRLLVAMLRLPRARLAVQRARARHALPPHARREDAGGLLEQRHRVVVPLLLEAHLAYVAERGRMGDRRPPHVDHQRLLKHRRRLVIPLQLKLQANHASDCVRIGLALTQPARVVRCQHRRVQRQCLLGPLLRDQHLRHLAKHRRRLKACGCALRLRGACAEVRVALCIVLGAVMAVRAQACFHPVCTLPLRSQGLGPARVSATCSGAWQRRKGRRRRGQHKAGHAQAAVRNAGGRRYAESRLKWCMCGDRRSFLCARRRPAGPQRV
eukprot:scaffold1650_cov351-Prasinococcus_capsulatus_cf.AAC.3